MENVSSRTPSDKYCVTNIFYDKYFGNHKNTYKNEDGEIVKSPLPSNEEIYNVLTTKFSSDLKEHLGKKEYKAAFSTTTYVENGKTYEINDEFPFLSKDVRIGFVKVSKETNEAGEEITRYTLVFFPEENPTLGSPKFVETVYVGNQAGKHCFFKQIKDKKASKEWKKMSKHEIAGKTIWSPDEEDDVKNAVHKKEFDMKGRGPRKMAVYYELKFVPKDKKNPKGPKVLDMPIDVYDSETKKYTEYKKYEFPESSFSDVFKNGSTSGIKWHMSNWTMTKQSGTDKLTFKHMRIKPSKKGMTEQDIKDGYSSNEEEPEENVKNEENEENNNEGYESEGF